MRLVVTPVKNPGQGGPRRGLAPTDPRARRRTPASGPGVKEETVPARLFISHSFALGRPAAERLTPGLAKPQTRLRRLVTDRGDPRGPEVGPAGHTGAADAGRRRPGQFPVPDRVHRRP